MFLVCPKCLLAAPSIAKKQGFSCDSCRAAWDAPDLQFGEAYFCDLSCLSVALLVGSGERFQIDTFPVVLGRDSDFKELQKNLAVSRNHFRLDADKTGIKITDLGSRGGTFLNKCQLPANISTPLIPGDVLQVAGIELKLQLRYSLSNAKSESTIPGAGDIKLSSSAPLVTIGGPASTADIELAELGHELLACLHTQTDGSTWKVLALKHGAILVNGEPVLECQLQPEDIISFGRIRYTYKQEQASLCPAQTTKSLGLAASKVSFVTRTPTGSRKILNEVNLEIPAGQLTAIIGASGSGKSTLAKILIGALVASSGELSFGGQTVLPSAYSKRIAGLIAFVPQDDIIHHELSIQETLDYAASIRLPGSATVEEKETRINRVLDEMELAEHRHKLVGTLSGGQRKRVNIAVELLSSPNILFLDEPTTGLDSGTEKQILRCLKLLARQGRTIVFITHSTWAMDQADHVIVLHDDGKGGRVLAQGAPNVIKTQHQLDGWANLFIKRDNPTNPSGPRSVRTSASLSRFALHTPEFVTMFLRYISIWISTPVTSLLILLGLPAVLGLLIRVAVPADGPAGSDRILFGAIAAFWLGMNQTVREIVKERTIMLREQFSGAGTVGYLLSKVGFFFLVGSFQAGLLIAPMLWLRVTGSSIRLEPSEMLCGPSVFWLMIWAGLCVGTSLGLFLSVLCLFVRTKGEILAVLFVILITLPQILYSPKVLDHLVEKTADYHAFTLVDPGRKLAEILSFFTASRYLYLPLAAIQNQKGDYFQIIVFNATILVSFALSCLVLAWVSLELFIRYQRRRTHW